MHTRHYHNAHIGLAVSRDGVLAIDCTVRNISEAGAKIKIISGQVIPERFYLIISGWNISHQAEVVWTHRDECGVKFVEAHSLDTLQGTDLQFLRRLMVEKLPRVSVA